MVREIYHKRGREIEKRLREFRKKKTENDIFCELAFCLLTPQSKAKLCWDAVSALSEKNLLRKGSGKNVVKELQKVRFKNKKAGYICGVRKFFNHGRKKNHLIFDREWLVKNIKGIGYKEASHFLRNIGKGEELAILDRHILKNLKQSGVIREIPGSLTRKRYFEIEKKMKRFSDKIRIPMGCLDLVLWCKETGEIFK